MDTRKFFVFGLQKSGSKYMKKLIEVNTNLDFYTDYTWKHTMDLDEIRDDKVYKFWITKSPYNWVRSVLYRHRVDILGKYRKYKLKDKDSLVVRDLNVKNLVKLYNDYHNTLSQKLNNVRYEELLNDCFGFFKIMSKKYDVEVKIPPEKNINTSKFYIKPEVREEYLTVPRYNDPLVVEINKYIDKDLLKKLNYEAA